MQHCEPSLQRAVERQQVGMVVRLLHQCFGRLFEKNAAEAGLDDITVAHGRILGFLARHADMDVFQRDIEQAFHINRSSVTSILQIMEKNGLIERHGVSGDGRLKKVCLTSHGEEMHRRVMKVIDKTEKQMRANLTPEELSTFLALAEKIGNP